MADPLMHSFRVLVCGGRFFGDTALMFATLDDINTDPSMGPITTIISDACRGADRLAVMWAKSVGVPVEEYPANWGRYGKAAGPIRNLQMLKDGKPDLVVAFSGGHGTLHMMYAARDAGVRVLEVL